jgi:hypothetical protein
MIEALLDNAIEVIFAVFIFVMVAKTFLPTVIRDIKSIWNEFKS